MPARAEDRRALRGHRAQAGPIARPLIVAGVGKEVAGGRQHDAEIGRSVRLVVARELSRRGQAQPVAHAAIGNEVGVVDAAQRRGAAMVVDRHRRRIALDRIDRQGEAKLAAEDRRLAGKGEDEIIAGELAAIGQHLLDAVARAGEAGDRRAELEGNAQRLAQFGEPQREEPRIAALVGRAVEAAGDLRRRRGEGRLDADAAGGIERFEAQSVVAQDRRVPDGARQRGRVAVQIEESALLAVVLQPGLRDEGFQRLLRIDAEAELARRIPP